MGFTRRTRVDTSRAEQLRGELVGTEVPEIVDRVIALEQEREMRERRDLRVYLGGLEHLNLRSRVLSSQRIASACSQEYDVLLRAALRRDACLRTEPRAEEPVRPRGVLVVRVAGIIGLLATAALLQPLASLGVIPAIAALLVSMGLCMAGELFPTPDPVPREVIDAWWSLWVEEFRRLEGEVEAARTEWRHAMAELHVRPLVCELLERSVGKPSKLKEVEAPGLRQARDTAYLAHTKPVEQFLRATERAGDGAIGLAGARGSGKSLLIESYLDGKLPVAGNGRRLTVRVSAPVQYEPQEFVLHLFATVCRAVIALTDPAGQNPSQRQWGGLLRRERFRQWLSRTARNLMYIGLAMVPVAGLAVLTAGTGPVLARWPVWALAPLPAAAALSLGGPGLIRLVKRLVRARDRHSVEISALRRLARRTLTEIEFLRTHTSGWTGKLPLPLRSEAGWSRTTQRAQRPLTHPELVARFREFLDITARALGSTPHQAPRVLVGIDELDKIESAEQAQVFLNQIKDVFGVPGCQFLVSLSEDALAAFERRGIPIRDVFDSAFDRIIQVSQIDYQDACLLLQRRIPVMPLSFVALCHCMSGGIPRDLVRVARAMVDLTVDLSDKEMPLGDMCVALVTDELTSKAHAFRFSAAQLSREFDTSTFAWKLSNLPPEPASLQLLDLAADLMSDHGTVTTFGTLQQEAASFIYYCATLLDVFTTNTDEQLMQRSPDRLNSPASFDALAGVRQKLGVDPRLAWLALDAFRYEWGLPPATSAPGR